MTGVQSHLAGLVLAAGGAARFAAPKQLARFGAETLVARAVRLAQGCCGAGVVVVTGAWAEAGLVGDRGARAVLAALPQVSAVPMPHAAADVDTAADLQRLLRS